ncbi:MAG: hypothetical protein R3282_04875 [Rhodothermales bacterium]|nr:hypothetical protein [Rhodothermales bacterium]
MKRAVKLSIYAVAIAGLSIANVHVVRADRASGADEGQSAEATEANPVWWKNYHWDRSPLYTYIQGGSSNIEAIRAINDWTGRTDIQMRSTTSHRDISVLRGNYGLTGWLGLAEIKSAARDPHCSNGYCEIRHCHASLNTSYSRSSWRRQGTYCMELGHCFGLAHDLDNGCMNSGAMNAGTSNVASARNVAAINGRY